MNGFHIFNTYNFFYQIFSTLRSTVIIVIVLNFWSGVYVYTFLMRL